MYISYPTPASQGAQGRTGSGNRMLTEQPTAWRNAGFPDCDRNEQNVHGGHFLYRCCHSLHRPTWRSSRSQCVLIPEAAAVTAVPRLGFRPIKLHMCDPEAPKHASETFFLHRLWFVTTIPSSFSIHCSEQEAAPQLRRPPWRTCLFGASQTHSFSSGTPEGGLRGKAPIEPRLSSHCSSSGLLRCGLLSRYSSSERSLGLTFGK